MLMEVRVPLQIHDVQACKWLPEDSLGVHDSWGMREGRRRILGHAGQVRLYNSSESVRWQVRW